MSLVKETVDRLLKGYDIRLRPDFVGNSTAFQSEMLHIRAVVPSPCVVFRRVVGAVALGVRVAIFSRRSKVKLIVTLFS